MSRKITIQLDDETRKFYHEMFLAKKLKKWVEVYQITYEHENGDTLTEEEILQQIGHKDKAEQYLTVKCWKEYLEYYDEIFEVRQEEVDA